MNTTLEAKVRDLHSLRPQAREEVLSALLPLCQSRMNRDYLIGLGVDDVLISLMRHKKRLRLYRLTWGCITNLMLTKSVRIKVAEHRTAPLYLLRRLFSHEDIVTRAACCMLVALTKDSATRFPLIEKEHQFLPRLIQLTQRPRPDDVRELACAALFNVAKSFLVRDQLDVMLGNASVRAALEEMPLVLRNWQRVLAVDAQNPCRDRGAERADSHGDAGEDDPGVVFGVKISSSLEILLSADAEEPDDRKIAVEDATLLAGQNRRRNKRIAAEKDAERAEKKAAKLKAQEERQAVEREWQRRVRAGEVEAHELEDHHHEPLNEAPPDDSGGGDEGSPGRPGLLRAMFRGSSRELGSPRSPGLLGRSRRDSPQSAGSPRSPGLLQGVLGRSRRDSPQSAGSPRSPGLLRSVLGRSRRDLGSDSPRSPGLLQSMLGRSKRSVLSGSGSDSDSPRSPEPPVLSPQSSEASLLSRGRSDSDWDSEPESDPYSSEPASPAYSTRLTNGPSPGGTPRTLRVKGSGMLRQVLGKKVAAAAAAAPEEAVYWTPAESGGSGD